jgi:hypothetical protein
MKDRRRGKPDEKGPQSCSKTLGRPTMMKYRQSRVMTDAEKAKKKTRRPLQMMKCG